jgi:pyridoxamine 5'-phosphate oxidase
MTVPPLPDYYDSLDAAHNEAWRLLVRGAEDRQSPFHTPTIATVDANGRPHARTVVLRAATRDARAVRFHTDLRSAKMAHLKHSDRICVLAYDPVSKIQLRIDGCAALHVDGALADTAWKATRPMSRLTYAADTPPGAAIEVPMTLPASQLAMIEEAGEEALDHMQRVGRENFCAVVVMIESIEWVLLMPQGNRRALFSWPRGALDAKWLQP